MPGMNPLLQPPNPVPNPDYSGASPEAQSLAAFIDHVHAQGMGALPPDMQIGLAQGPTQHSIMPQILDGVKQSLKSAETPFISIYHEATQHLAPTVHDYVKTAVNGTNNDLNAMTLDPLTIQKNLQAAGYGTDLPANGVWSSSTADNGWSNAFYQWQQDQGKKPGTGSTGVVGVARRVAHDLDWRVSLPALWRSVSSLTSSVYNVIGNLSQSAIGPLAPGVGANVNAAIRSFGGQPTTPTQANKTFSDPKNMASDTITVLNMLLTGGMGASAAGTVSRGLAEAATAGGGNVAKGLVTSLGKDAAVPRANMMNLMVLKPAAGVAKGLTHLGEIVATRVLPNKVLDNIPSLRYIYPGIDLLKADAQGAWQGIRNTLAIPYRYPLVRTLAPLANKAAVTGTADLELAGLDKKIGDPNSPLSLSMDHLTPITGIMGDAIMVAQLGLLHGNYDKAGKISELAGKGIGSVLSKVGTAVNDQGHLAQWERGTGATYADTLTHMESAGVHDPQGTLNNMIAQQFQEGAVNYAARLEVQKQSALAQGQLKTDDMINILNDTKDKIWSSRALMQQAVNDFTVTPNGFQAFLSQSVSHANEANLVTESKGIGNLALAQTQARIMLGDVTNLSSPESRAMVDALNNGNPGAWDDFNPNKYNYGIAKNETLTSDELSAAVASEVKAAQDRLKPGIWKNAKGALTDEQKTVQLDAAVADDPQLHQKLVNIALNDLGLSTPVLLGKSAGQIEEFLHNHANLLAANVYTNEGKFSLLQVSEPWALEAEKKLNALGYKMVYGTHIGHNLVDPIVPFLNIGKKEALLSKTVNNVGLGLTKTNDRVYSMLVKNNQLQYLQKYFDRGAFHFPPGFDAAKTMQMLQNKVGKELSPVEKWFGKYGTMHVDSELLKPVARALSAGRLDKSINELMKAQHISRDEAKVRIQQLLAQQKSPRDWTKKQVTDVLTAPYLNDYHGMPDDRLAASLGVPVDSPFMDNASADKFYNLMQEGSRKTPARLQGIGKFTDLFDNQFGLAGIPMGMNGARLPNLTGRLKSRLLQFRYPLNLQFAWKRVVKTNIKAGLDGIPPTANAGDAMRTAGTYEPDMARLRAWKPQEFHQGTAMDDVLREIETTDVYNVFNPKEIQARILGFYAREAMADPANLVKVAGTKPKTTGDLVFVVGEDGVRLAKVINTRTIPGSVGKSTELTAEAKTAVLKKLESVYSYGDRSALERSTNAVFFPFSFEKTVMRQLGAHLLDHPGRMLLAGMAMDFYDSHNGPVAKKWAEDNLPMIKQLEAFYPYSYSMGLGIFGGMSRLLGEPFFRATMAMFSPKLVKTHEEAKVLLSAIPMFKQFNQVFGGIDPSGKTPFNPGGDFATTAKTSIWYVRSKYNSFVNHSSPGVFDSHAQEPYRSQINDGFNLQSQLVSLYADELKGNHEGHDWRFPNKMPFVGAVGNLPPQKITMDAIKTIVQNVYPAWDKNKGVELSLVAKDKVVQLQRVIAAQNPELLPDYQWFVKNSEYVIKQIQADAVGTGKLPLGKLADYTLRLRSKAVELAALDRDFAAFYKQYYQNKFGPLGAIR
jgi:hypothetical protein